MMYQHPLRVLAALSPILLRDLDSASLTNPPGDVAHAPTRAVSRLSRHQFRMPTQCRGRASGRAALQPCGIGYFVPLSAIGKVLRAEARGPEVSAGRSSPRLRVPDPVTLFTPTNGPLTPVTLISRISAFLMFAMAIPFTQLPGHVGQREPIQRLAGMDAGGVRKLRAIHNANVRKLEILERRNAFVARHGHLILNAAAQSIDAQKPAASSRRRPGRSAEISSMNAPRARASLDVDREGLRASELAPLDADVANAARRSRCRCRCRRRSNPPSVQFVIDTSSVVCSSA